MAPPPAHAIDWRGNDWTPDSKEKAAHPNSRFATPMRNNPVLDPDVEKGEGVPISAIIFGGRRSDTMPLVFQALDWEHGVYIGATMASETTAAATGAVGQVRRDPMAMLPFCGYNIGEYFRHWLEIGPRLKNPPLIFQRELVPQSRRWKISLARLRRQHARAEMDHRSLRRQRAPRKSPIGWLPRPDDLDLAELEIFRTRMRELLGIEHEEWKKELAAHGEFFDTLRRSCAAANCSNSATNWRNVFRR